MDDANQRLEGRTKPLRDPVRRPDIAGLNENPFTQNTGHPQGRAFEETTANTILWLNINQPNRLPTALDVHFIEAHSFLTRHLPIRP
jgi:hypothetical protein